VNTRTADGTRHSPASPFTPLLASRRACAGACLSAHNGELPAAILSMSGHRCMFSCRDSPSEQEVAYASGRPERHRHTAID